jgi:capsular exopolysaccharide synthesis family protein
MSVAKPKAEQAQLLPAPIGSPILVSAAKSVKEPEGIALSALVHALRRRWPLALLLGIVVSGIATVATWFLLWPKYTSSAYIQVDARHVPLLFTTADQAAESRNDYRIFKSTQRQMLLTPFVLNNALSNETVANLRIVRKQPHPTQWLQEELDVTFPDEGEIMRVSFSDYDPEAPRAIVQAVVDAFMSEVVDTEYKARTARLLSLQTASKTYEDKIRTGRHSLDNLVATLGTSDEDSLSLEQQSAIEQYGVIQNKLREVQFERIAAEQELALWRQFRSQNESVEDAPQAAADDGAPQAVDPPAAESGDVSSPLLPAVYVSEYVIERAIESDNKARELANEVERLETRIRKARERMDAASAAEYVQAFEAQLVEKKRDLEEREAFIRTEIVKTEQHRALEQQRNRQGGVVGLNTEADLEMRIGFLKGQEERFQAMAAQAETEAKKLGRSSIEVEMTSKEIEALEAISKVVHHEIERTRIELGSDERIELIGEVQPAYPPDPVKRVAITSVAGVGGFFVPLLLLVWTDLRNKHVDSTSSVSESLNLSVLGSVPRIPPRLLKKLDTDDSKRSHYWRSKLIESTSSIAALLMRTAHADGKRIFMITSPSEGEGKSTVSVHVARTLAEANLRTLLIDFDLRRPTLHNAFGLSGAPGVAEILADEVALAECIQPTEVRNLSVLVAGKRRESILINSQEGDLKELFTSLGPEFDFVIVDACPVLPVVDARLIGQHVDGVILSLARDVSRVPKVMRTCELLTAHGIEVLGTIVVGCSEADDYYAERKLHS